MTIKPDHEQMIERIYREIVGDEYTEGLIPKVNKNTQKIEQHDIYFKVILALGALITTVVVFLESFTNMFK